MVHARAPLPGGRVRSAERVPGADTGIADADAIAGAVGTGVGGLVTGTAGHCSE